MKHLPSTIYDPGSANYREDGMFLCGPFSGVVDAFCSPYGPKYPVRLYNGMSGGELVARTIERYAYRVIEERFTPPLNKFIVGVDAMVDMVQEDIPSDAGELAGATFAFAKVGERKIDIVQGGDCFALWKIKDGSVGITKNQVRAHDTAMNAEIEKIQREVAKEMFDVVLEETTAEQRGKIRGEMWNRFYFSLKEARRQDANNPKSLRAYAVLNGQLGARAESLWFSLSLPRESVQTVLLFSDGMVPWEAMKGLSDQEVAEKVMIDYQEGGLPHLLRVARGIEKKVAAVNYTDSAEATAIALEF